jgi:hypothetical protein
MSTATALTGMPRACSSDPMGNLQIKDVPPELHDELRRRARDSGQSLRDYVLGVLQEEVSYMTLDEWLDLVGSLPPARPARPGDPTTAELIRAGREEREAELLRRTGGGDSDAGR